MSTFEFRFHNVLKQGDTSSIVLGRAMRQFLEEYPENPVLKEIEIIIKGEI